MRVRGLLAASAALLAMFAAACGGGFQGGNNTVVFIPGYSAAGGGAVSSPTPAPLSSTNAPPVVDVSLGETDATHMFIKLSQTSAPQGKVSFLVTNTGTKAHEFVVLQSKTPADSFPIASFEGEANRINEAASGVTNVGETGDPPMAPGSQKMLTIDMAPGHYAVVCNLPGHYKMGMHQDFWVSPS
jgi:uncharacterized cupredoxin-like copper-binding protein